MSRAHMARPPKGLAYMDLNREQTKLLDDQVKLVVQHQIDSINPRIALADHLKELARNCYLQGVLDGQQLFRATGSVLVPREPTPSMLDAGLACHDGSASPEDELAAAWRAMVAAAHGVTGTQETKESGDV